MDSDAAISVSDLKKTYRDGLLGRRRVDALRGVSFSVGRGEIFGLLGPNGAGKTTLVKVLLGIVRSTQGQAQLLGRRAGDRQGRKCVGYLPEHHRIPRHHTGNSALLYYGSLSGLSASEIRARRPALLETVGLGKWGDSPIRKYSKGMLQRLGLAQAMLHDPELLILDEPTDGVDPVGRSEMRTLLERLKAEGKTVFLNSHLLQEVELICDRVVIVDHGRVLKEGRIDDLTWQPDTDITLVVNGDEAQLQAAIGSREVASLLPMGEQQFEIALRGVDQSSIDQLVDELRRRNLSLVSLTRRRQTLEEAFLRIIHEARGAA